MIKIDKLPLSCKQGNCDVVELVGYPLFSEWRIGQALRTSRLQIRLHGSRVRVESSLGHFNFIFTFIMRAQLGLV